VLVTYPNIGHNPKVRRCDDRLIPLHPAATLSHRISFLLVAEPQVRHGQSR
jgi:hypothetical protein